MSIGVVKSAQELFEKLEMWEDVIGCLVVMDERTKALALCRQELAKDRTPRLLCVLGDLTGDKDMYREAWALSGRKCFVGVGVERLSHAGACVALGNINFNQPG